MVHADLCDACRLPAHSGSTRAAHSVLAGWQPTRVSPSTESVERNSRNAQTRSHFHRPVNARMAASTGWFSCLAAQCLGDLTVFLLTLRRRRVFPYIICSFCLMYATSQRVADAPFANPTHHTTMLLTSCNTVMYCFSLRYCLNATRSGRAACA